MMIKLSDSKVMITVFVICALCIGLNILTPYHATALLAVYLSAMEISQTRERMKDKHSVDDKANPEAMNLIKSYTFDIMCISIIILIGIQITEHSNINKEFAVPVIILILCGISLWYKYFNMKYEIYAHGYLDCKKHYGIEDKEETK